MKTQMMEVSTNMGVTMSIDKRVMNNMDPDTKAVHLRLEAWGAWSRNSQPREYPAATVLARVIEQGPMGAAHSGQRLVDLMPQEVARTERAVLRLGQIDRKVVMAYYLDWAPVEMLAPRCRMRKREFENVLKRARWRISGFIAGMEEQGRIN
jgi:hypothetical protein